MNRETLRALLAAMTLDAESETRRPSAVRRAPASVLRFLKSLYTGAAFLIRKSFEDSIFTVFSKVRRFALDESLLEAIVGHLDIVRSLNGPGARAVIEHHPNYVNKYVGRYLARSFDKRTRREILKFHHAFLDERVTETFYEQVLRDEPPLWVREVEDGRFSISLSFNAKWHAEGDLSLLFNRDDFRLYEISFTVVPGTLVGSPSGHALFVGRVQGAVRQADAIRAATRACHDVAPSHLLMVAAEAVASALAIDLIAGVGNREQVAEDDEPGCHFNYDVFWETFPVKEPGAAIYQLLVPFPEKPLAQIKTSHRRRSRFKREFRKETAATVRSSFEGMFLK